MCLNLRHIFFGWASRLPPHRLQLHLVGLCLLRGQQLLPLEVAVHHDDDRFIVAQVSDNAGQRVPACQRRCHLASVAGDQLIAAVRGADHCRNQNAELLDAFCHLVHSVVLNHPEGMIREVVDLVQGNVDDLLPLGVVALLLCRKEIIERGQMHVSFAVRHRPLPPS